MRGVPKKRSQTDLSKDLWISPRLNMRGPDGNRGFSRDGNIAPGDGARFLELADIALGFKKPQSSKSPSSTRHQIHKTEPYNG
jgi:hypothetical protein